MKSALRAAVVGAAGRMGQTIIAIANSESVEIVSKLDQGDQIASAGVDVLIDFSQPDTVNAVCEAGLKTSTPLVIGTTGHSAEQRKAIESASKKIPIVLASNFSVGVNALFWLTGQAARILDDGFDLEIVEMHHRLKKDAPSGTARTLAEILQGVRKTAQIRHGREGMVGERDPFEI